ncbi:glycosyltransferase [uncultured Nocardioides sp.]|uniref:glycosyltransferase n=1 Tax=uncultured Nocardioides sp. TaxID=198441 RepID=UPI00262DFED8|nr:glycosyltransferase [uncultured Nocardioides sp.]
MTVCIAHDYCTQRGGAERVALTLLEAFDDSVLVTSLHESRRTFAGFGDHPVRTSHLQKYVVLRHDPRRAFPLLAHAWDRMTPPGSSAVICSSSGWAHGLRVPPGVRKLVYCHNPARWLYQAEDYFGDRSRAVAVAARSMSPRLRRWDRDAAESADLYVANSSAVARRIKAVYGIDAVVVNPPSALDPSGPRRPVPGVEPGYLLSVGRARGYKHIDVVAEAVARHGTARLVVVGGYDGVEALRNVTRLQDVSDDELRWLYANATAVVSLSHEDFGLTPVEGFGFGTPAVLLRDGGFLDSMVEGVTGVFAEAPTQEAFLEALERLPGSYDPERTRRHATRWTTAAFQRTVRALLAGDRTQVGAGA